MIASGGACSFAVPGEPIPAPRQSRRDAWKPRACVLRCREFKDRCRASTPADLPEDPEGLRVAFYLAMPPSWSVKKKEKMRGQPHRQKPDTDNLLKALKDALWEEDSGIWQESTEKRWDDGKGPRVEVQVGVAPRTAVPRC